jgi:hypothetical protein
MQIRKLIERRIRRSGGGINVESDVNAVVAANVGEQGAVTHVSSTQRSAAGSKSSEREREATD